MAAEPAGATLYRDTERGILTGVCAGIAGRTGIDPLIVRIAFAVMTLAGGVGVVLYLIGLLVMPVAAGAAPRGRRLRTGRAAVEVALGVGLLVLSVLLAVREAGLWFSDAVVWPLVLIASGAALLWRQSTAGAATAAPEPDAPAEVTRRRVAIVSKTGLGIALVIAAGIVFLYATDSLSAARDVVLVALVVAVVLAAIFAPLVARLWRSLTEERRERIRSQERAEMAAHLHDSVLQTLALVQRRSDDPREVATLARRQERELRSWLSGGERPKGGVASALEDAAAEVERTYGVPIELVAVGDRPLDEHGEAVVAAAREAMTNAAKFAGESPVDVYAEAADGKLDVFVRDRGPGFDAQAIPDDRHGLRESIVGRMERHGGKAIVRSSADGTEIELVMER